MEMPEKVWSLIARSLNGEATPGEQEELIAILRADEALQQQYDLLSHIWKAKEPFQQETDDSASSTVSRIINKARNISDSPPPVLRTKKFMWMAAAVLVVVMAGLIWTKTQTLNVVTPKVALEAKNGSRTQSILPDGSKVWLNAGSKLYYENDFRGTTREVRLDGEAFFDIAHITNRPFIVHTSGIDIKVLGTAFNVKSYEDDKNVETTLYRGLVEVIRKDEPGKAIELRPNQRLIIQRQAANAPDILSEEAKPASQANTTSFTIAEIDSSKQESERIEIAWLYSRLEFRGDSFSELAKKMERWYNVRIIFTDAKVKQLSFDGSFEKENVEQAFAALKAANAFNYKINENEISVGSPD